MFVPMFDRSYFTNREMSLVDQNYPLLNQYLRMQPVNPEPENAENAFQNEEEQGFLDNLDDEITAGQAGDQPQDPEEHQQPNEVAERLPTNEDENMLIDGII